MPAAARSASRFSAPIFRAARHRAASSTRRGSKLIGSRSGSVLENGDDLALLDELVLGDQHLANGASLLDVVGTGKSGSPIEKSTTLWPSTLSSPACAPAFVLVDSWNRSIAGARSITGLSPREVDSGRLACATSHSQ
jgi:hypothetical protein